MDNSKLSDIETSFKSDVAKLAAEVKSVDLNFKKHKYHPDYFDQLRARQFINILANLFPTTVSDFEAEAFKSDIAKLAAGIRSIDSNDQKQMAKFRKIFDKKMVRKILKTSASLTND